MFKKHRSVAPSILKLSSPFYALNLLFFLSLYRPENSKVTFVHILQVYKFKYSNNSDCGISEEDILSITITLIVIY